MAILWAVGYVTVRGGTIDDSFFLNHPAAAEYARTTAGALIKGIDATTRSAIRDALARLFEDPNVTEREVVAAIDRVLGGSSASRAETIARTEAGYANGWGSSFAWREIGVEYVGISDGVDRDLECAEANGQIWTLARYEANMLEHPNCTRAAWALQAAEVNLADVLD